MKNQTECKKKILYSKWKNYARVFQNKDCSNSCIKDFHAEERKKIFNIFWNLSDFNKQNILPYEATKRMSKENNR